MVYLRHRTLPYLGSSAATQSRTPESPPEAPTIIWSLSANGAAVIRRSVWFSVIFVSQPILPVSLSVATMRGGQLAGEIPRLFQKAAPRLVDGRSCLGSMRQTIRPRLPERPSIL